jgi:hypothetical protein
MHFWKTLCIKKVDLTHLLSPAIYPQIILYHHDHPHYKYHVLPKKIRPKKYVFCSIPFNIPKLPLENNLKINFKSPKFQNSNLYWKERFGTPFLDFKKKWLVDDNFMVFQAS